MDAAASPKAPRLNLVAIPFTAYWCSSKQVEAQNPGHIDKFALRLSHETKNGEPVHSCDCISW